MGLDFTSIADKTGAALYMLSSGMQLELQALSHLKVEIERQTSHQLVLLDVHTTDGEKVRDFYDIKPEELPVVLVVRDDDTVVQMWSRDDIPTNAGDIAFQLRQTSEA